MLTVLFIILILLAIGGLPTWGYHANGYGFSGLVTLLLVILLVLMITGNINF
jgi:hypothetical protein